MTLDEALNGVSHLFLDTAPIIYFVEQNPMHVANAEAFFQQIDAGRVTAVTSPITLSECLVYPYRLQNSPLQEAFIELIGHGNNTQFVLLNEVIAIKAAQLRATYNLSLADALQLGAAITNGCEAFLTNDQQLKRVQELRILVLDEIMVER